ncbi:hypothetical protein D9757_004427 [Collybiopsis confluens]|uniref:Wax synthase domain-containing protein n=1 Tax=Collybiopsis confluens TaxID=2823264 RepID=A0A8H5HWP2_9AGAR|nr:hypothetical protein D9757_004427 [Collybiopsis confluens]
MAGPELGPSEPSNPVLFAFQYLVGPTVLSCCILASRWRPLWARLTFFVWYTTHIFSALSSVPIRRTGYFWSDYSLGSTLGGDIVKTMYMLFFVDPVREWEWASHGVNPSLGRRIECTVEEEEDERKRKGTGTGKSIANLPWWKRVYWILCGAFTMRGVGWNYQVSNIPLRSESSQSTSQFLHLTFLRILSSFLLLDSSKYLINTTPFFTNPDPTISMRSQSYVLQAYYALLWFTIPYASLKGHYSIVAFVAVFSGYSTQEDWPNLFGSWGDAWSVKNVWGKVWHQMYRRQYTTIAKSIITKLYIHPRSVLSYLIHLYVAFLISGISHSFGDYTLGLGLGFRYGMGFGRITMPFFILQPLAIIFEHLISTFYTSFLFFITLTTGHPTRWWTESQGDGRWAPWVRMWIGYGWTLGWFTYSVSWFIDSAVQAQVSSQISGGSGSGPKEVFEMRYSVVRALVGWISARLGNSGRAGGS